MIWCVEDHVRHQGFRNRLHYAQTWRRGKGVLPNEALENTIWSGILAPEKLWDGFQLWCLTRSWRCCQAVLPFHGRPPGRLADGAWERGEYALGEPAHFCRTPAGCPQQPDVN
ncbi:hypothetical protein Arth_3640 [Arthrobacter sp. FB24]|nr:hypothetical protein Arth_3640 [Arthrobacter sp. FB24]